MGLRNSETGGFNLPSDVRNNFLDSDNRILTAQVTLPYGKRELNPRVVITIIAKAGYITMHNGDP